MRRWIAVMCALTTLVVIAAVANAFYGENRVLASDVEDWKRAIERSEIKALQLYIEHGRSLSYDDAHALAHVVGEALYYVHGIDGIARCTNDFSYGCYHAVAATALLREGPGIAENIKRACENIQTGTFECIHGAGHGILAYTGEENLERAFDLCEPFNRDTSTVGGCFGGIMMEYNFRTMQSASGIDVRPFDGAAPAGPCPHLPDAYTEACYYELPPWWRATLLSSVSGVDDWRRIGTLCEAIPKTGRSACYRGIGNVLAPQSGYSAPAIEAACSLISSRSGAEACLIEGLGHLLATDEGRVQIRTFCQSSHAPALFCQAHADSV